jgi:hypothetical protein
MRCALITLAIILSGCADSSDHKKAVYGDALKTHRCTPEQFKSVEDETHFCVEETSYYSSYCFATAIMRNCTPIAPEISEGEK